MAPAAPIAGVCRSSIYVVTEYGAARLKGAPVRQRVKRLISIAHPDFRAWLQDEAGRLQLID
jgi:acyl-CoA hydrolase